MYLGGNRRWVPLTMVALHHKVPYSIGSRHKEGSITLTFKGDVYDSLTMSISVIGTSESTCMEIFISLGEPVNEATK